MAAAFALTACNGMFGSSSSSSPSQGGSYNSYNSSRDSGAIGPSTHDQNRE